MFSLGAPDEKRHYKLYRVYLDPLNFSNVGDFSWRWILKVLSWSKMRQENLSPYVHVLYKTSH